MRIIKAASSRRSQGAFARHNAELPPGKWKEEKCAKLIYTLYGMRGGEQLGEGVQQHVGSGRVSLR